MKTLGKHSDSNFIKGFSLFILFDQIIKAKNLETFLGNKHVSIIGKERFFKISKVLALSATNEHLLVEKMYYQFDDFDIIKKELIEKRLLKQIIKNQRLKGNNYLLEAKEILREATSGSKNLMTPPILQYIAGYTMGELLSFVQDNFSIDKLILEKFKDFKEKRNFIIHNSTSSREDVDENLNIAIDIGLEIERLLKDQLKPLIK